MGVLRPHYTTVVARVSERGPAADCPGFRFAHPGYARSGVYAGTSASTRSGLPEPFSILSGVRDQQRAGRRQLVEVGEAGEPELFAPCIR